MWLGFLARRPMTADYFGRVALSLLSAFFCSGKLGVKQTSGGRTSMLGGAPQSSRLSSVAPLVEWLQLLCPSCLRSAAAFQSDRRCACVLFSAQVSRVFPGRRCGVRHPSD